MLHSYNGCFLKLYYDTYWNQHSCFLTRGKRVCHRFCNGCHDCTQRCERTSSKHRVVICGFSVKTTVSKSKIVSFLTFSLYLIFAAIWIWFIEETVFSAAGQFWCATWYGLLDAFGWHWMIIHWIWLFECVNSPSWLLAKVKTACICVHRFRLVLLFLLIKHSYHNDIKKTHNSMGYMMFSDKLSLSNQRYTIRIKGTSIINYCYIFLNFKIVF